jgi:adenylyltransferase/sulfurtransferase
MSTVNEITVQQLKEWKDSDKKFQLIDVRDQHEYEFVNIGAELIPLSEIMDKRDAIKKDCDVVLHCRSGARSANAIMLLQDLGHKNLYNLKGGILAYAQEIDPSLPQY